MTSTFYRVSTANMYDSAIRNLGTRQKSLVDLQENLTSGKRVVRPSDDPVAAAQAERALTRLTRIQAEQRQLEIAMVLATDAQVMLLDEPLAGMGSEESAKMVEVLKRLRQTRAILLVEQNAKAALDVADTGYVMETGTISFSGSGKDLLADDRVRQAYLGM